MLLTTHTQNALFPLLSFAGRSIKRICEIAWKKYNQNCFQMTYNC